MRVVAGTCRGRKLAAPQGRGTRPTSDRVREAVFNALGSLGAVEDADVVDLFAGSGALGIEALSRGAARCTFVESSPGAASVITGNLRTTGLADRAEVECTSAERFVSQAATLGRWFDLALVDPPYEFDGWNDLLGRLPATIGMFESDRPVALPGEWEAIRERRYGGTVVLLGRREPDQACAPAEPPTQSE